MSLSEFSYYLRRYGPIGLLGLVLFLVFFAIIRLVFIQITSRPVQVEFVPPYGQLPALELTTSVPYPQNPEFIIDNIEGRPVTATSSAQIFFIPSGKTRFSYAQTIALMGRAVGFDPELERHTLVDTTASFENSAQSLEIDITNFNFTYSTNFENTPELFEDTLIPSARLISEEARAHLRRMDRYPDALARGTESIIYLKFEPGNPEPTVVEEAEEANAVEVQLYPPDIGPYPIVTPNFFKSQNYVVMVFKETGTKVIKSQIRFFERSPDGAAYPVKSGDQAWNELINGEGTIVSGGSNSNRIRVTDMFLGYYEPDAYQEFLQPVYVFLGDNNFAAYVPAVANEYVEGYEAPVENQENTKEEALR